MAKSSPCPRQKLEQAEAQWLCPRAARSTDEKYASRRHPQKPDEFRTEYQRDYTRIVHSRTFRRLRHKAQVFISPRNDHLCTRLEHSLHVASVAGTIAQALGLNVDLVRAIAVGHDLGHAPFGHKGEANLARIARRHGLSFSHELHSLRVVDQLESPYKRHPGLNLTFAVRDGIVCHHGESFDRTLKPNRRKKPDDLARTVRGRSRPATLEGCVVRWADKIAYLGRDLEDALDLKMVRKQDIPPLVRRRLGATNSRIIGSLVRDLVANWDGSDSLSVGAEIHEALNRFYDFSRERVYRAVEATRPFDQIDRAMESLFDFFLEQLERSKGDVNAIARKRESFPCLGVFADFLGKDLRNWRRAAHPRVVVDFIAGMTDSYFVSTFAELFLPTNTV